MTQHINFSGNNRFAILPEVIGYGQGGPVARLYIVPMPEGVKPGQAISLEQLRQNGDLEKGTVMTFDNPLSIAALHQQTGRAYQSLCREVLEMENIRAIEEAAKAQLTEEHKERTHIEEMARVLADRKRAFDAKYGIPDKGPNHAHNYDKMCQMHNPRQEQPQNTAEQVITRALAEALGTDAGSIKVILGRPANVVQPGIEDLLNDPAAFAEGLVEVMSMSRNQEVPK